uniref:Uncharacterized protein n=1 Tax=Pectinaria gouldii TaxID=260746 RepID=A0A0K1QZY7_PECGU|nr:hypothetical protein [Pectinaria gouldii]
MTHAEGRPALCADLGVCLELCHANMTSHGHLVTLNKPPLVANVCSCRAQDPKSARPKHSVIDRAVPSLALTPIETHKLRNTGVT